MSFTIASRTLISKPSAVLLASLIAASGAAGLLAATSAHAAPAGSVEVSPATGTDTTGISLTTSKGCPEAATHLIVSVKGSGFPAEGQNVVSNSPLSTYATTQAGGIVVPLTQTMRDYASTAGFTMLQGRYDFTLTCRTAFNGTSLGDFPASIWFTSNTAYRNTDPAGPTTTPSSSAPTGTGSPSPTDAASPTDTASPTDATSPTDTATPTDSASPTDTALPSDSAAPTDTATPGGGSQGISTDVSGGGSGGGKGSLAATGTDVAMAGAASAVLVAAGIIVVRRTRRREEFPVTDTQHV